MPDADFTGSPTPRLLTLTAQIVAAHVAGNTVASEALPALIQTVHSALAQAGADPEPVATQQQPAVPIRRSVLPDYLVCLEDGGKVKMLKRYLATRFGLTPEQYRTKWGLPGLWCMEGRRWRDTDDTATFLACHSSTMPPVAIVSHAPATASPIGLRTRPD